MSAQRFVIVGRRRDNAHPWNYYVTSSGFYSTSWDKAAVIRGLSEAKAEVLFHNRGNETYEFHAERLLPRLPLKTAILSSVPVEM